MPGQGGPRRIIPIQKKNTLEFRFIGGKLNIEPSGSKMIWASCVIDDAIQRPVKPKFSSRSLGSIGGVVNFRVAQPMTFKKPCSQDISRQLKTRKKIRQ